MNEKIMSQGKPPQASEYPLLGTLSYKTLLVTFNLFVIVAWMPRVTSLGSSDIGANATLLAAMAPLMLIAPHHARVDQQAVGHRLAIYGGVCFLLLWGYLGIFRLDDPFRAGRLILSVGQGFILVFVVSQVLSVRALRFSLALSGAVLACISLISLYNYFGGAPKNLTFVAHDRSSGLFKNPNQYGMIMAMGVPFGVALYLRQGYRVLATLLLGSIFIGLLMAASKTNLILALLMMLVTLSYTLIVSGQVRMLLIVLPVVTLALGLGGIPLLEYFNPRAAGILTDLLFGGGGVSENTTVSQRIEMWSHSLNEVRRSPLFGQGTGQKIDTTAQLHSHSHNMFVDLARTTGLPGLMSALLFVIASCWLAIRTLSRVLSLPAHLTPHLAGLPIVVGACFAILSYIASNQMSDSFGPSTSVFFWLCVGLLLRRHELLFENEFSEASEEISTQMPPEH